MTKSAVIFARVFTQEQETDGHSIYAQIDRLREYCQRNGLNIIKEFSVVESSTKGERPVFNQCLEFIKNQKGKIALVADKVDRLQRSILDIPKLEELRINGNIVIHFLDIGRLDDNANSQQKAFYRMSVVMANSYTDAISDNVKRSYEKKLKEGTILGPAPIGYLNAEQNGKKTVIIDPLRGYIIKKLFIEYSTGLHSVPKLHKMAIDLGLKTKNDKFFSQSQIDNMISNPFYYGVMQYKNMLYPHIYEKLITKELFDDCQDVKHGRSRHRHKETKTGFIFTGLIKCKHCDCAYSPYLKKEKYVYLRPSKKGDNCPHCQPITENFALDKIKSILKQMQILEDVLIEIKNTLHNSLEAKKQFHNNYVSDLNRHAKAIQTKLDSLLEKFIDDSITKESYDKYSIQLRSEQHNINHKLGNSIEADEKFSITLSSLITLASNSYKLFESSHQEQKHRIISLLCSNLKMNDEKLEISIAKPFDMFINVGGLPDWLPNGLEFRTCNTSFDEEIISDFADTNDNSERYGDSNEITSNQDSDKIKFIKWLAITLNTKYSKEVGMFFEQNRFQMQ